ncbi:hypothetical protein WEB32_01440 [Streptomyces netropsis]|uniref:Uncharacterized protein n=1 Tax=Streptomyces netropsis TaxID=55404 RepID=A0A7W7LDY2_STRNE|nr:hypothetical protein [Streptomyces netropsis]MBB4888187.1 hypothetical protein [Streptomyces netropsis]GGR31401.1 hypothetical protein GCM10010219_40120 [Streptomyces netropsis]
MPCRKGHRIDHCKHAYKVTSDNFISARNDSERGTYQGSATIGSTSIPVTARVL